MNHSLVSSPFFVAVLDALLQKMHYCSPLSALDTNDAEWHGVSYYYWIIVVGSYKHSILAACNYFCFVPAIGSRFPYLTCKSYSYNNIIMDFESFENCINKTGAMKISRIIISLDGRAEIIVSR